MEGVIDLNSMPIDLDLSSDEGEHIGSEHLVIENTANLYTQTSFNGANVGTRNDEEEGPRQGKQYANLDSLFEDYQAYAKRIGFSACKRSLVKRKGCADIQYALFVCSKAGVPRTRSASKKVDCKARLNAKRKSDGSWLVTKICDDHKHDLDPNFSILMPAHRTITTQMGRQVEANDRAGIQICKNIRFVEVQSGGPEKLGCIPRDIRNFIDKRRRMRLGDGDAEAVRKLFMRLKEQDANFFYLFDVDKENRLRNVLWIHPRSRAAYEDFNDAVSFDTTYLVNRHQMPFACMVGINHHGHSILLGCALVTHESIKTFKWLFSNWLIAMGGVPPKAIITDQCDSIRNALKEVMPTTIHRFCLWHIMAKLPIKFKGVKDYNRVITDWKGIVYDSLDIQSFEMKWSEFVESHNLASNRWLADLYSERDQWVPVYLNQNFWAGMISTQRSEGMHAYFDGFLHSRCSLISFMEQYEMAMSSKIQKEFMADFDSKDRTFVCMTSYKWEKQFQQVYTIDMFKRVQAAIERMAYCIVKTHESDSEAGIDKYGVLERKILNDHFRKEYTYIVKYERLGEYLECNCRSFEFKGLLCCHIFEVMRWLNIEKVHDRYILKRWRKDVQRRCSSIFFAGGYPHMTDEYKIFQRIEKNFQLSVDVAFGSQELMNYIDVTTQKMKKVVENWGKETTGDVSEPSIVNEGGTPILNPHVTKTKGRPPLKRILCRNLTIN